MRCVGIEPTCDRIGATHTQNTDISWIPTTWCTNEGVLEIVWIEYSNKVFMDKRYLLLRKRGWYVRYAIPQKVQHYFDKTEFVVSLKTRSLEEV